MRKTLGFCCVAAVILSAAALILNRSDDREGADPTSAAPHPTGTASRAIRPVARPTAPADRRRPTVEDENATPQTEEEKREAEEEKAVDDFDELTDNWMEPSDKGVSVDDVAVFVAKLKTVPAARQEECLQRALNLIPDENVMLLVGVLMDRSFPPERAEQVFDDILNRDDSIKAPILNRVRAMKSHPCHATAAWILDVTGDPAEENEGK